MNQVKIKIYYLNYYALK